MMKLSRENQQPRSGPASRFQFDRKLAAYFAGAASVAPLLSRQADAVIISNSTPHSFGINESVNIDFNSDGQTDYQIDHDRVNIGTAESPSYVDYLQLDKNEVTSAESPYGFDFLATFPLNGTQGNGDHYYISQGASGDSGFYPKALTAGTLIRPTPPSGNTWEIFQETDGFGDPPNQIIRANRLIDEDHGQVDALNPNPPMWDEFPDDPNNPLVPKTPVAPFGTPAWIGLGGQTRYLGVRIDLNDAIEFGLNDDGMLPNPSYLYGWIGVQITNEADATGVVTGWGYNTTPQGTITAGQTGLEGDYNLDGKVNAADYVMWRKKANVLPGNYELWRTNYNEASSGAGGSVAEDAGHHGVPEPGSLLLGLFGAMAMLGAYFYRRVRGA